MKLTWNSQASHKQISDALKVLRLNTTPSFQKPRHPHVLWHDDRLVQYCNSHQFYINEVDDETVAESDAEDEYEEEPSATEPGIVAANGSTREIS